MKSLTVKEYYNTKESKWGYFFVMGQSQHIGFYDDRDNSTKLKEKVAQKKLHDQIVKYLKPSDTDKILDIGCGQGFVASDLAKRYNLNITGIDITPYMITRAQRYSKRAGVSEKTNFFTQDYNNTTFPDNSFDYIYAVETLCHSTNLRDTLKELYRILKPGGKFVSLEYSLDPSKLKGTKYEDSFYQTLSKYTASPSLYLFEDNNFTKIAKDSGFELVEKIDVTENCFTSVKRLSQLARIPYFIIKKLHLEKTFINIWLGANWQTVVDLGYWGFMHRIYKKPGS
jgi:ubiquinone/menaquinone biosynthesis C-methylase UbiE